MCIVFLYCIDGFIIISFACHVISLLHPTYCYQWLVICYHAALVGKAFLGHGVCLRLLILYCYSRCLYMLGSCQWILFAAALHCWMCHCLETICHPLLLESLLLDQHLTHLSLNRVVLSYWRMVLLHSFWICFWLCYIGFGMCCSMSTDILMISTFLIFHTPLWL